MHPFFEALVAGDEKKYAAENPDAFNSGYADFDPAFYGMAASVVARAVAVAYPVMRSLTFSVAVGYMLDWSHGPKNDRSYARFVEAVEALKAHAPSGLRSFVARYGPRQMAHWIEDGTIAVEYAELARIALDAEISYLGNYRARDLVSTRKKLMERFNLKEPPASRIPAAFHVFG